ncbi:MAG TPA: hypothetical protein VJA26_02765 [Gammaproteobacteria bacterium]|nr:hypothetical protein [Gammaproteobacteria bacterium]
MIRWLAHCLFRRLPPNVQADLALVWCADHNYGVSPKVVPLFQPMRRAPAHRPDPTARRLRDRAQFDRTARELERALANLPAATAESLRRFDAECARAESAVRALNAETIFTGPRGRQ